MASEIGMKNLRPFNTLSKEEARKIQSAGGKASAKAIKKKKKMKEAMECLMSSKIVVKDIAKILKEMGFEDDELNNQLAVAYSQMDKAIVQQDTKAAEFCRNTMGEKPIDVMVNENVDMTIDEYVKKAQDETEY